MWEVKTVYEEYVLDALPGIVPCPLHLQYLLFNARLRHPAIETVIRYKYGWDYYSLVVV